MPADKTTTDPPRDSPEWLVAPCCTLRLFVEQYFRPTLLSNDYRGPQLVVVAFAGRATALTKAGLEIREIELDTPGRLMSLAAEVRREPVKEPQHVTVEARTVTVLTLCVEHVLGGDHSFVTRAVISHAYPRVLPPAWSALLYYLRDIFGPGREEHADAWDLAMTWCAPFDLGPMWNAGREVVLPHIVTALECEGRLKVRIGPSTPYSASREVPSSLYRLTDTTISLVEPFDPTPWRTRWHLPCGGASITFDHRTRAPHRRILIRRDDLHEVSVERG